MSSTREHYFVFIFLEHSSQQQSYQKTMSLCARGLKVLNCIPDGYRGDAKHVRPVEGYVMVQGCGRPK
jgi:hypothetical protein